MQYFNDKITNNIEVLGRMYLTPCRALTHALVICAGVRYLIKIYKLYNLISKCPILAHAKVNVVSFGKFIRLRKRGCFTLV